MGKLLHFLMVLLFSSLMLAQQNISANDPFNSYNPFFYPDIRTPPPSDSGGSIQGDMFGSSPSAPTLYILYIITPSVPRVYWKDWTYDVYTGSGWSTSNNGSWSKAPLGSTSMQFQVYRAVHPGNNSIALVKPPNPGSDVIESTFILNDSANYSITSNLYNDHTLSIDPQNDVYFTYNSSLYNIAPQGRIGSKSDIPQDIYRLNTALPANFPAELRQVALNLTNSSLDMMKQALKTRNFVRDWVNYNLSWGEDGLPGPNDDIALWTYIHRQGICGHYATLFAVLLRAQGIPARVDTGYAGGLEAGNYTIIFGTYAHAWTEVYIPPYGWIPIDATGTSNETKQNKTGNQTGDQELNIDWSSIGKTTLDLQFSLDKRTQSEMSQSQKNEVNKLNQSGQSGQKGMNLSNQNNFNSSKFNWSSSANRTSYNYSGLNYSQLNSSRYNQTSKNWTSSNQTSNQSKISNQTQKANWTEKSIADEQKKKQELEKTAKEDIPSKIISSISSAISAAPPWLMLIIAAVALALVGIFYLLKGKAISLPMQKQKELEKAEIRRWVDIDKVIAKVKIMGQEGKKGEAVIYGYNELADYIAYVLSISNRPSLTAREFTNQAAEQKKAEDLFKSEKTGLLRGIVFIFEDSEYGEKVTDGQFNDFVTALEKLRGN
ncbi:MAG: transglutaminase domain-containing protein [Candidatus Micrarchaeota archaeon]|nr:transglutaminase domain-containing protein [Candidatus Micrarchaeota archaeon]